MPNFHNLQNILEMDFTQLRALPCADGRYRASDAAIVYFVNNLVAFFTQFAGRPTLAELEEYLAYMNEITFQINISEYAFAYNDYQHSCPDSSQEEQETMARHNKLDSFKSIPVRMQFWAAAEQWSDPIRNPVNHGKAIDGLEKWGKFFENNRVVPERKSTMRRSLFQTPAQSNDESAPSPISTSRPWH